MFWKIKPTREKTFTSKEIELWASNQLARWEKLKGSTFTHNSEGSLTLSDVEKGYLHMGGDMYNWSISNWFTSVVITDANLVELISTEISLKLKECKFFSLILFFNYNSFRSNVVKSNWSLKKEKENINYKQKSS